MAAHLPASASCSEPLLDLNTTPLIDVMLVLLVMMIMTLPMQTHSVGLDLPGPPPSISIDRTKNLVAIASSGAISWNGEPVSATQLRGLMERAAALPEEPDLQLRPDPLAPYSAVDRVLADAKRAGVSHMGFVGNEQYARF